MPQSSSKWRIFPPPPKSDHEKLQRYSKRQPLHYSYQEGDNVFMMVPSCRQDGKSGRHLVSGRVVRIERESDNENVVAVVVKSDTTRTDNEPIDCSGLYTFDAKDQRRFLQPNMSPTIPGETPIILVQETAPFRQVAQFQLCQDHLHQKDRVLELGCSTGELSKRIWKADVQAWVGIDVSSEMTDRCKQLLQRYLESSKSNDDGGGRYNVLKVDPLVEPHRAYNESMELLGGIPPTVVCVDIGGNREHLPVMEILSWVFRFFSQPEEQSTCPRLVMIKSRSLVRAMLADDNLDVDASTGNISDNTPWFHSTLRDLQEQQKKDILQQNSGKIKFKHPVKYPLALSPNDGITPICKYHNYHPDGCKRQSRCEFDHEHCHACRKPGHRAVDCPAESSCY